MGQESLPLKTRPISYVLMSYVLYGFQLACAHTHVHKWIGKPLCDFIPPSNMYNYCLIFENRNSSHIADK